MACKYSLDMDGYGYGYSDNRGACTYVLQHDMAISYDCA